MGSIKNLLFCFAAVLGCMSLTLSLASCSDDDDDSGSGASYSVVINYNAEIGADVLTFYDVTVTYLDKNGAEKTEAVTSTTWSYKQTMKEADAPTKFKCSMTAKRKSTLPEITKDCVFSYTTSGRATLENSDGIAKTYGTMSTKSETHSLKKDNVATFLSNKETINLISYEATK